MVGFSGVSIYNKQAYTIVKCLRQLVVMKICTEGSKPQYTVGGWPQWSGGVRPQHVLWYRNWDSVGLVNGLACLADHGLCIHPWGLYKQEALLFGCELSEMRITQPLSVSGWCSHTVGLVWISETDNLPS